MERYRIDVKESPHGWTLTSTAFNLTVDAGLDELDGAIGALKALMADSIQSKLDAGEPLPMDDALDEGRAKGTALALYMETDFANRFVARTSETVRRNISMPAWMDLRLRRNGIDASKLFQEAAAAKLKELELINGSVRKITNVEELEDACSKRVLDMYFERRMKQVITDGMKGRTENGEKGVY